MSSSDYILQFMLAKEEERRRLERERLGIPEKDMYWVLAGPPLGRKEQPSKVIHITDLQDYCRCKRAWNWSSMLRRGLQPSVSPAPLFFGSAIHYALDYGYQECIGRPVALFDLKAALDAFKRWIKQHVQDTIKYTGPLWDFETDQVEKARQLGILMLRHYALWAAPLDKLFRILGMEYKFKVPLPGYECHGMEYAGRFDGYIEDVKTGDRFILEFKTAKSVQSRQTGRTSSNIEGVLRGMQSAAYTWASSRLPDVHDKPAQGVLYRFLCKKEPGMPQVLHRGGYSRAKSISSSVAWYHYILHRVAVEKHDHWPVEPGEPVPDVQAIYESELARAAGALAVLRDRQTIQRGLVVGNEYFLQLPMTKKPDQVEGALDCLVNEGSRMIDPHQPIYPTSGFHCNWCSFKAPCDLIAYGHGDQVEAVLDAAYGPRVYWEPEVQEEY